MVSPVSYKTSFSTSDLGLSKEYSYGFNGMEKDDEHTQGKYDFGARIYDSRLGRWLAVDVLARKYSDLSTYCFVANKPIIAIDPDGKRIFFVAGAGNDAIGWNYAQRFKKVFANNGFSSFTRLNVSHDSPTLQKNGVPPLGDIKFTSEFRLKAFFPVAKYDNTLQEHTNKPLMKRAAKVDAEVYKATLEVFNAIKSKPLKDGEQLNLMGYSYGSVVQAHVALALADMGVKVDNLVLIGSPIPKDSELYKALIDNKNITNVIRHDIPKDKLSNPNSLTEFIEGGMESLGEDAPHFDLARPDNPATKDVNEATEADKKVDALAKDLKTKGVKQ